MLQPPGNRRQGEPALGGDRTRVTEVFDAGQDVGEHLTDINGLGVDVLYECTGVASLFQPSAELVRRGGTLALLGFPMTTSEVSYGDWQIRELSVIGSLADSHNDFLGAQRAIADGSVQVTALHSGTISLSRLAPTMEELDSGHTRHSKVLVDPRM